jgi:uncharacterized RDD family membrane protein YckC
MAGISAAATGETPRTGHAPPSGVRRHPARAPGTASKLQSCDGPLAKARSVVPQADARAGLARRLAATVYESMILAALALVLGFVLLPLLGLATAPAAGERLALISTTSRAVSFAALFTLYAGYCVWFSSGGRRTLPMQAWRLALRTTGGRSPSPVGALVRYLAWWIGPACAIAAYVVLRPLGHGRWALAVLALNSAWAFVDADRQFLHDRIAGTRLVRV